MRKLLLSCALFCLGLVLSGCSNKEELEQLKIQNDLLQQQMDQLNSLKEQEAQVKQEKQNFENNLKCQERGDEMKKAYNNVFSASYDEAINTCIVTYMNPETKKMEQAPMDNFGPVIKETPLNPGNYTVANGVNFRESPSVNGTIIQKIDPSNPVYIMYHQYVGDDLRYYVDFYGKSGRISSAAFK